MKIGLSYSRCILDIVEGRVDINDVLVIITRTDFDPHNDQQWQDIWEGYHGMGLSNPEWRNYGPDDEDKFRSVSVELWENIIFGVHCDDLIILIGFYHSFIGLLLLKNFFF